jgi:hypothetical protein
MGLLGRNITAEAAELAGPEWPKRKRPLSAALIHAVAESLFRGRGGGPTGVLLGFLAAFVARALLGALSFCWRGCALIARTLVSGASGRLCERKASAEQQCKRDRK